MTSQNKVCLSQMYSWQESNWMTDTSWLFILSYVLMLNCLFRLQARGSLFTKLIQQCVACIACIIVHFLVEAVWYILRVKVLDEDVIQLIYMHLYNKNIVTKLNYFYKLKLIQIKRIYF